MCNNIVTVFLILILFLHILRVTGLLQNDVDFHHRHACKMASSVDEFYASTIIPEDYSQRIKSAEHFVEYSKRNNIDIAFVTVNLINHPK